MRKDNPLPRFFLLLLNFFGEVYGTCDKNTSVAQLEKKFELSMPRDRYPGSVPRFGKVSGFRFPAGFDMSSLK